MIFVAGATHSQKDGVERNGGFSEDGAEAFFVLFRRGAQLVLRSSEFTVSVPKVLHKIPRPN